MPKTIDLTAIPGAPPPRPMSTPLAPTLPGAAFALPPLKKLVPGILIALLVMWAAYHETTRWLRPTPSEPDGSGDTTVVAAGRAYDHAVPQALRQIATDLDSATKGDANEAVGKVEAIRKPKAKEFGEVLDKALAGADTSSKCKALAKELRATADAMEAK